MEYTLNSVNPRWILSFSGDAWQGSSYGLNQGGEPPACGPNPPRVDIIWLELEFSLSKTKRQHPAAILRWGLGGPRAPQIFGWPPVFKFSPPLFKTDSRAAIPLLRSTRCIVHRSRDHISSRTRCSSDTSDHVRSALLRQIRNRSRASMFIIFICCHREFYL